MKIPVRYNGFLRYAGYEPGVYIKPIKQSAVYSVVFGPQCLKALMLRSSQNLKGIRPDPRNLETEQSINNAAKP